MAFAYVVQKTVIMSDILLLTLAPRRQSRRLLFEPGQYAAIGFVRRGRPTPMRCFSVVSTPSSGLLQFAMRISGDFTQAAARLGVGAAVRVQGPFGSFVLDPIYDTRIVMFAGGIGITPFMSMLRDATERQLSLPITILYANRSAASIPFHEELTVLQQRNPYLRVQFFCSQASNRSDQSCIRGSIDAPHIEQMTSTSSTYFICGPDGFTQQLERELLARGVHESRILHESFAQTTKQTFGTKFGIRTVTYGLAAASLIAMIGFITILDLSRSLSTVPSAIMTSSASTSSSADTAKSTASQQTYTYQPPVSSVS